MKVCNSTRRCHENYFVLTRGPFFPDYVGYVGYTFLVTSSPNSLFQACWHSVGFPRSSASWRSCSWTPCIADDYITTTPQYLGNPMAEEVRRQAIRWIICFLFQGSWCRRKRRDVRSTNTFEWRICRYFRVCGPCQQNTTAVAAPWHGIHPEHGRHGVNGVMCPTFVCIRAPHRSEDTGAATASAHPDREGPRGIRVRKPWDQTRMVDSNYFGRLRW